MPIKNDSLNRKLYDLLNTRGYKPIPRDSDISKAGKTVPAEEADVFKFTFVQNNKEIDDAWVSIDGSQNLTLYYDQDLAKKSDYKTPGIQFDDSWYGLLKHLKKWAHNRQLSFNLEPREKIDSDMAQRTYMKKKEQVDEGYYPMGKSASYNDNVPTVKIILQHTRQIQEGEQRYRNIAKIFLENTEGERILAPTKKPGIAQVYARHLAEGGLPNDERWNHIKSLCEEYGKMAGFVRAVRGNQFNEGAQKLVDAGLNHYLSLRESLSRMRGNRGYNKYFEDWTPTLMETEGEDNTVNELFVQETLDPRIESVMPILSKLSKSLNEIKEVNELSEWANNIIESDNGDTPINKMSDQELADYLGCSLEKVKQDREECEEKARDKASDLNEEFHEEVDEGNPKSHQAQTTLKHLKKQSYGDRADAANIKPGIAGYRDRIAMLQRAKDEGNLKDELDEQSAAEGMDDADDADKKIKIPAFMRKQSGDPDWKTTTQDLEKAKERNISSPEGLAALKKRMGEIEESEEVEESGLQAYLGNKKYGEEGMDALRKAGREGASKKEMDAIRDKHDKLDEDSDLDQQAMTVADKLTTGKNLEKLQAMAHDSTVYRALDRYFAKNNIPENIYNRVAHIVFKRINPQGVAEGSDSLSFWKREAQKAGGAANIDWYSIGVEHGKQGIVMNPPYGVGGKAVKMYSKGLDAGQQGVEEGMTSGSMEIFDKIEELEQKLKQTTDPDARLFYEKKIKELEHKLHSTDDPYDIDNPAPLGQGVAEGSMGSLMKQYSSNEHNNNHSENIVLLAKHFGTPEELAVAQEIVRYRDKHGGLNYSDPRVRKYVKFQQIINDKYVPLLRSKKGVAEDLDSNQKRAGQLGPTEKVGSKGAVGKLVGASESFINTDPQAVVTEMDKSQKGPPGWNIEDDDPNKKQIHLGPESMIKKKDLVKQGAEILNKAMDDTHKSKKDVKEGQEELDSLLRLLGK